MNLRKTKNNSSCSPARDTNYYSVTYVKDDILHFKVKRLGDYTVKTNFKGRLICVRFVPIGCNYVMEIVYEKEVKEPPETANRIASIDLGVDNFVTLTNNIGLQPIIINGKGIKSVNQRHNKQKAKIQSDLMRRNGKHGSKKLESMNFKRNMRVKNFLHNVSRWVINYCIENNIDTLVCGYNAGWKQECVISKLNNQKFLYLPYETLISQFEYKCQDAGINFIKTEESYTSGTSFLDGEIPCVENYDKSRRIKRGLFQAQESLINADVNASLQIMRKVFPDALSYGIKGVLTPVIINVTKVA